MIIYATKKELFRHKLGTLPEQFRGLVATKKERLRNNFVAFLGNRHKNGTFSVTKREYLLNFFIFLTDLGLSGYILSPTL